MTARTAIITGGAGGLGLAMARGLLADDHRVAPIGWPELAAATVVWPDD